MSECMGDPYAAQIRAAKAEGELARIKDELRDFAEENGFNPELEPRDLLAKATGAFRSCTAMSDARYTEIQELKAEMEAMRPRLMPEGMEWPRYEDGSPVLLGDATEDSVAVRRISFTSRGFYFNSSHRKGIKRYRYGKRVKRPAVLAADNEPLEAGQTVWSVTTGEEYTVVEIYPGMTEPDFPRHCVKCEKDGDITSHMFRPYQLTHQRPVLDANGVLIKGGDTVWSIDGDGPLTVESVRPDDDTDKPEDIVWCGEWLYDKLANQTIAAKYRIADQLTHTKPEPADSIEILARDIMNMAEAWHSKFRLIDAQECASKQVGEQNMDDALDSIARRCKALAERERGE